MWFWKKNKNIEKNIIEDNFSYEDEVTDEIELSLRYLKEKLDLPTEEVQLSIDNRREIRLNRKKS